MIDRKIRSIFRKIGVPESQPFKPDPFQIEALARVENYDVLVSAPTGAGKTWIASQTIHAYLPEKLRVWYASPLKALSNSIYEEFCLEFGQSVCGILTGDRKENPDAPIIVGTTEIFRNQLYDAINKGSNINTDLVILDEAHYLNDPDRGVVWEEVLIYLPVRVRLLLLSATIPNAEEISEWLTKIRSAPCRVVRSEKRPVPLKTLFLFPDGLVTSLNGKKGLNHRVKNYLNSKPEKPETWNKDYEKMDFGLIIKFLRELDLLPAIFFLKSRRDCNQALLVCPPANALPETRKQMKNLLKKFLNDYPHLKEHSQTGALLNSLVCSHHGGQLPYWKVLIEKMMSNGYPEAIFSTSTIAAGVNFPARSVVLLESVRYDGHKLIDLTATELHQMIGRAGRRGQDNIGFAIVVPGPHQNPQLIYDLNASTAEPILSQIHINFSMTLNLLFSQEPSDIKFLLERSFAAFKKSKTMPLIRERWKQMLSELKQKLPEGRCDTDDPYEIIANIRKMTAIQNRIEKPDHTINRAQLIKAFKNYLRPGRLFLHKNGKVYIVFRIYKYRGSISIGAHDIEKSVPTTENKLKLEPVDLDEVQSIFDYSIKLPSYYSPEIIERLFDTVSTVRFKKINIGFEVSKTPATEQKAKQMLSSLPCGDCDHMILCHRQKRGELNKLLREFKSLFTKVEAMDGGLWLSFKRYMRFLKETGFVNTENRLSPEGVWASRLRLEQPLLIAELIRKGALDRVRPELLACSFAPFVWNGHQNVELRTPDTMDITEIKDIFQKIIYCIRDIAATQRRQGFYTPVIQFWPVAALYLWSTGLNWHQLLEFVPIDEGDMASLILRTSDHLKQVINLRKSHPELADAAESSVDLILREPVHISRKSI